MQTPLSNSAKTNSQFIYLTCQHGAEPALKKEIAKRRPDYRFSFSRPGFITFKLPEPESIEKRLALDLPTLRIIFARSCSNSLGRVALKDAVDESRNVALNRVAEQIWELVNREFDPETSPKFARIHVYGRDQFDLGTKGFEPGLTEYDYDVHRALYQTAPEKFKAFFGANADRLDAPGDPGETCLDVVVVEKNEFHIGFHRVSDAHSRYPGGLFPLELPTDAASRAFLKFEEGLRWADFPIGIGSRCVDIGAAPGGGSQALLARGAEVLGVDPAEIDPRLLINPNFTHLQGKISQLKRKLFRKSRWFLADMNVAPQYTLDVFEELVAREDIAARGLLFTLKLFDWKLADSVPEYISRIKSWGFNHVKARQLQFNRQEIMIAALKKPFYH